MTTTTIARLTDSPRRRSVNADLFFWTAAGAVVAAFSAPLSRWWYAPQSVLLAGGLSFALLGPVVVLGLNRTRPTRRLVAGFVATNVVLAPLTAAAAWFDWLALSAAGNWALAGAAAAMVVLGVWQFTAWRR